MTASTPSSTQLPIEITQKPRIKNASATVRDGTLYVSIPKRWSKSIQEEVIAELVEKVRSRTQKRDALLNHRIVQTAPRITLDSLEALTEYVTTLNAQTFNAPLRRVQMGQAKYSRLAQMNVRTHTMTISQYCLNNVPEPALRYLVLHELAHCYELSHNARFWKLVEQHVPDYKLQSRIIKALHANAVNSL